MIVSFTGSQVLLEQDKKLILAVIQALDKQTTFVTGGCIGADYLIAQMICELFPANKHIIVLPSNRNKVPADIYEYSNDIIEMPINSTYRDRNMAMVNNSDRLIAFWTGKKMGSGTFMTMNIANKQKKLNINDIIMIGANANKLASEFYSI